MGKWWGHLLLRLTRNLYHVELHLLCGAASCLGCSSCYPNCLSELARLVAGRGMEAGTICRSLSAATKPMPSAALVNPNGGGGERSSHAGSGSSPQPCQKMCSSCQSTVVGGSTGAARCRVRVSLAGIVQAHSALLHSGGRGSVVHGRRAMRGRVHG